MTWGGYCRLTRVRLLSIARRHANLVNFLVAEMRYKLELFLNDLHERLTMKGTSNLNDIREGHPRREIEADSLQDCAFKLE